MICVFLVLKCVVVFEFLFCGIVDDVMVGYVVVNIIFYVDYVFIKYDWLRVDLSWG